MVLRSGLTLLLVALVLAGCGRQGSLQPPNAVEATPAAGETNDPGAVVPDVKKAAPDKPFILDRLI